MKKLILLFVCLFGFVVYASSNQLYFKEENNQVIYTTDNANNAFMSHLDMIPGSSYTDVLHIKNETSKTYKLYLKVEEVNQSNDADDILNYISMKLLLDDKPLYDGVAKGLDYSNKGVNLQNTVFIREFAPNDKSELKSLTSLSTSYSNKNLKDDSKIKWIFYVQNEDEEPIEIIPVPITDKNVIPMAVVGIIVVLIGICLFVYGNKKEK